MNRRAILIIVAVLAGALWGAPSWAAREAAGKVASMRGSTMVVETADRDRLHLEVTGRTVIFLEGGAVPVKRVMPGAAVRVIYTDRHADTIIVQAVPK